CEKPLFATALGTSKSAIALYFLFGGYFLLIGAVLIYLYALTKLIIWVGDLAAAKIFKEERKIALRAKLFIVSVIYLFFAVGIGNFVTNLAASQVSRSASPAKIIAASQWYNALDNRLFGFDPVLAIHQLSHNPIADFIFLQSYQQLTAFFGFVF